MGGSQSTLLDRPWREINWRQKDDLLKFVKNYNPEGASHLRVLLYGPVGAGKSSFINSAASVILSRLVNIAVINANNNAVQSFTKISQTHKIKSTEGRKIPIVFSDIMGLEPGKVLESGQEDVILAMKGHVKDGYEFDQTKTLSQEDEKYNENPTFDDRVHVLVCILNANTAQFSPEVLQKIMEIKQEARTNGVPWLAIATHIDKVCDEIEKDVKNVYKSIALKQKMEYLSSKVGIPMNYIFPVWNNYEGPDQEAVDVLFLNALKHIVNFGDDYLFNISNG